MLYTITRPADAPGPHLLTLSVLGGRFPFERGTSHDVELDPKADGLLIGELRRDGYVVKEAAPAEEDDEQAPEAADREQETPADRQSEAQNPEES